MSGRPQRTSSTRDILQMCHSRAARSAPFTAVRLSNIFLAMVVVVTFGGCARLDTLGDPQPQAQAAQSAKSGPMSLAYVGAWGMKGSEPGQLDQPTGIATDQIGNSYIPDIGSLFIHKFDARGTPLLAFQDPPLAHPQSVAVDRGGAIYVTDTARGSVFVFFPNGDQYREIRLPGRGNAENMLSVAVDDDGIIYVLDGNAGKIFAYNAGFRLVRNWQPFAGSAGASGHAGGIAYGFDGYVYVADPAGNRILKTDGSGHVALEIRAGSEAAHRKLSATIAAANKHIFVMDADGRMLHVWDNDGKPALDVDLAPELGQGTRYPPALAVSARNELLVLDDRAARVLRYKITF